MIRNPQRTMPLRVRHQGCPMIVHVHVRHDSHPPQMIGHQLIGGFFLFGGEDGIQGLRRRLRALQTLKLCREKLPAPRQLDGH